MCRWIIRTNHDPEIICLEIEPKWCWISGFDKFRTAVTSLLGVCLPFRQLQYAFFRTGMFGRELISELILDENKRGLGMFLWKSSKNNTSWNISVPFLENCVSISRRGKWMHNVCKHEAKPTNSRGKVNGNIWDRNTALQERIQRRATRYCISWTYHTPLL